MTEVFEGSFTQQEPIPEAGIEAAIGLMRHGRLHRYNVAEGELGETALLEQDFAAYTGASYALAVASGGYAMGCAMRAIGVKAGDRVLSNGFTLAPVPGAIASLGAVPVFVEVTDNLTIDLHDLATRIETSGAKILLLSHMRGHLCDMDALMDLCSRAGVQVIEDCAHTMGARWRDTASGRHGVFGCYSCQTYKHINSGEGGLLVSDDDTAMARAIMLSGSYMLYERHAAAPSPDVFEQVKWDTPNISGRMDNLRAAILRPQLANLDAQVEAWNARYEVMERGLQDVPGLRLIQRNPNGRFVGSSFQFLLPNAGAAEIEHFAARCADRGVELKWFGAETPRAFTSRYDSWRYAGTQRLAQTDRVLAGLLDMRLPLTFSLDDCALIARIIRDEAGQITNPQPVAKLG
ncbi:DegT/DnrJ/EryC1/StrS family aminotransferase [Litoreibacter roseus]|uniref:Aminotransferase DegT n=1 Tax=Litoreibacter roseus TaxID=2601869 RepID=A0A6N6JIK9_9RHOB|nr:DegT/DnrJ/EryC1/StrS family aminotransferase [Litoreibacter roseus]GFE65777.1 aminotransferase DegT [Litoreibacter roseus]